MGSVGPRILSFESIDYFEQVKTSVVEKKNRRILISKTSMVRLTGQLLNMLSRCKKMEEQKVRLFLKQPSVLFIDVIVNKYFHINLQQVKLEDKNQDQLSHCRN